MKRIIKMLCSLGLLLAATGCDQDQTVAKFDTSGEDAETAWFLKKSYEEQFSTAQTGTQVIELDLFRSHAAGAVSVGLSADIGEDAAPFFKVPASVTFAAGEYRTIVPIEVKDVENLAKGKTYAISVSVDNAASEHESTTSINAKYTTISLSASVQLVWKSCYVLKDFSKLLSNNLTEADYVVGPDGNPIPQGGVYTYTFYWVGEDDEVMLERAEGTNMFRLTNWGGGVSLAFTINADKTISLDMQSTGASTSGVGVVVSDLSIFGEGQEACMWDGDRTFTLPLVYMLEDGRWWGETCVETFVMSDGSAALE